MLLNSSVVSMQSQSEAHVFESHYLGARSCYYNLDVELEAFQQVWYQD